MKTYTLNNRRFLCILTALVVAACCAPGGYARPSTAPDTNAADEAAIRENVRGMEVGWNTKSGALFAKSFAADADYVVVNGMHIRGREAIAQGHQRIFDTIYKNSTVTISIKQIRFLRPDVAVVHVQGVNKVRQGEETREMNAMITLVLTKEKGEWKIAAFQNTQIAPDQTRTSVPAR
jgi:uncharacterized protein (TIGR02246 family)